MAAGRIVVSQYFPARDRNDRLVAGAKLYVYQNGTTTPAAIFTASDLATPLVNPVVANSSGQFVAIWADDAVTYTVSITGPNGESIGNPSAFDDVGTTEILSIVDDVAAAVSAPSIALIEAAGDTEIAEIGTAGTTQVGLVETAGTTQVAAVEAAGTAQVLEVASQPGSDQYGSVADALSKGVWSVTITAAGSGGTNGTYPWTTTGGTGTGAAGYLVIAGGVVTQVAVTHRGKGYTTGEALAITGTHGLTGHTLTLVTAQNEPAGKRFQVVTGSVIQNYVVDAGGTTATVQEGPASKTAVDALDGQVGALDALFDALDTTNLFDPATGVDGGGVLGNGNTFVTARYGLLIVPVTAGLSYTVTCAYASTDWDLDQQGFVNFYNSTTISGANLIDSSTASPQENGVTYSDSGRTVSFTAPTGAVVAVISIYNLTTASPSAGDFDAMWALIMANTGTSRIAFSPYIAPGTKDFPANVKNAIGPVRALLDGTTLYVRQPMWNDPTRAHVRKISYGDTPSSTEAGTMDFLEHRFVDSVYDEDQIVIAFNAGVQAWIGSDNGPPLKYNGQYLGGGHGVPGAYDLTIAGHGLTNADVGDVGTISGKSWVLVEIVGDDTITVLAANTGASDEKWTIVGSPAPGASGTITFAAAGAKSYTASVSRQLLPMAQNYAISARIDGETDLVDGTPGAGDYLELRESYGLPNPAAWMTLLISEKGTATPKTLIDASVPTQVYVDQVWRFDRYGAMVGFSTFRAGQTFEFRSDDYIGAWQHQAVTKTGYVAWQYVAGLGSTVGGLDFTATAQISANASQQDILNSISSDVAKPPSVFCQFLRLSGTSAIGLAHGYLPTTGVGRPAERDDNTYAYRLSASEKMYPVAIDGGPFPVVSGQREVAAGTMISVGFWDLTFDMTDNPERTVDAVMELPGGKALRIVDVHDTLSFDTLEMPADLTGRPVTALETQGGFTLHSDEFVPAGGLTYSVSGGYGRAIIEVGT